MIEAGELALSRNFQAICAGDEYPRSCPPNAALYFEVTAHTGHKVIVFPQIFSHSPQNSTTEREPSQYRHVLIPLVHIDGRTMPNVFPQIFSSFPQNSTEGSLGTAARGPSSPDNRRRRARHLACHHVPFPTVPRSHHGKSEPNG